MKGGLSLSCDTLQSASVSIRSLGVCIIRGFEFNEIHLAFTDNGVELLRKKHISY